MSHDDDENSEFSITVYLAEVKSTSIHRIDPYSKFKSMTEQSVFLLLSQSKVFIDEKKFHVKLSTLMH